MTLEAIREDSIALDMLSGLQNIRSKEMREALSEGDEYSASEKMNDIMQIFDYVCEIVSHY